MRRVLLVLALALCPAPAALAAAPPPGAAISDNLEYRGRVPGSGVVEGKFDTVAGLPVMIVTGTFGFRIYDVSDPDAPKLLDGYQPPEVLGANGYWQDEDMDLDVRRKLIIGALDPRHDDVDQASCPGIGQLGEKTRNPACRSGFYVISYADPTHLRQIGDLVELPAGHTASCIDGCRWVWTGGPARRDDQAFLGPFTPGGRGDGRPIWVTDLRDPAHPVVFDQPIDLGRNDGLTDYSHDVQVDAGGTAWVSGRGGILGYATRGRHRDPRSGAVRQATPLDPILVAGGGVAGTNQPVMFMHNSARPLDGSVRASGVRRGNVLIGTEEDFTEPCAASGRIVLSDLTDSLGGGPAAASTPEHPFRMRALDTFHPAQDTPETTGPSTDCSAHYFELSGPTLAAAWYGQGVRLVDVSDARDVRQIGFFRVTGDGSPEQPSSLSWDVGWHAGRLYLFDMNRGVEILRLRAGAGAASRQPAVTAPSVRRDPFASVPVRTTAGDPLVCPLFAPPPGAPRPAGAPA
jgi:hypothetical protein